MNLKYITTLEASRKQAIADARMAQDRRLAIAGYIACLTPVVSLGLSWIIRGLL